MAGEQSTHLVSLGGRPSNELLAFQVCISLLMPIQRLIPLTECIEKQALLDQTTMN